jgi:exonuclease III
MICRCGDLNVSHQSIDLANPSTNKKTAGFTQEERDDFAKILSDGFIDACKLKILLNKSKYLSNSFPVRETHS